MDEGGAIIVDCIIIALRNGGDCMSKVSCRRVGPARRYCTVLYRLEVVDLPPMLLIVFHR